MFEVCDIFQNLIYGLLKYIYKGPAICAKSSIIMATPLTFNKSIFLAKCCMFLKVNNV